MQKMYAKVNLDFKQGSVWHEQKLKQIGRL
jgi:hypothetical protein